MTNKIHFQGCLILWESGGTPPTVGQLVLIGKFTEKTLQVFRECEFVQTCCNTGRLYSSTYTFKPVLMKIFDEKFECFFT